MHFYAGLLYACGMRTPESERHELVELGFLESVYHRCPNHIPTMKALGDLLTQAGRIQDGLAIDRRLCELCPDESEVWYNLACSLALAGDREEALDTLEKAVCKGYSDAGWMLSDDDLEGLRNDPRFKKLLERLGDLDDPVSGV